MPAGRHCELQQGPSVTEVARLHRQLKQGPGQDSKVPGSIKQVLGAEHTSPGSQTDGERPKYPWQLQQQAQEGIQAAGGPSETYDGSHGTESAG